MTNPTPPHPQFDRLIEAARRVGPVRVAVAHPCDRFSIEAALDAAEMGLIVPVLVGPRARIQLPRPRPSWTSASW